MTMNKAAVDNAVNAIIDSLPEEEKLLYEEMRFGLTLPIRAVDDKAKKIDIYGSKGFSSATKGAATWQPLFDFFKSKKRGNHSKIQLAIDILLNSVAYAAASFLEKKMGCTFVIDTNKSKVGDPDYEAVSGQACAEKMMRLLDKYPRKAAKTDSLHAATINAHQETHMDSFQGGILPPDNPQGNDASDSATSVEGFDCDTLHYLLYEKGEDASGSASNVGHFDDNALESIENFDWFDACEGVMNEREEALDSSTSDDCFDPFGFAFLLKEPIIEGPDYATLGFDSTRMSNLSADIFTYVSPGSPSNATPSDLNLYQVTRNSAPATNSSDKGRDEHSYST